MKKIVFIIISSLILSSCSKGFLFNKKQLIISDDLKAIINSDQAARNYNSMVNIKYKIRDFYFVCDSLYNAGVRGNFNNVYDFSKIQTAEVQIANMPEKVRQSYYNDLESGGKLMSYIDDINRKKLYQIINKYGYPSFYNRKWIDTTSVRVGITVILTHTDPNSIMGKKTLKLMLKEYFKNRVEEREMKHYMWHVDGREGTISSKIIDSVELKKRLKTL